MGWLVISLILCVFGFLKEFRPSEPFVTDFLTGPWKNFTDVEVNRDIYPVGTYSYLTTLILIFLITDFVRYKPIIILSGLSGTITYILIILVQGVALMQVVQFMYGLFCATEVAYYTYIYAKVDKKHYQEVTSHTRTAYLLGKFTAGVTAQLTTSYGLLDYYQLNFITLSALATATIWALFLPSVGQSVYFHRTAIDQNRTDIRLSQTVSSLQDSLPIDHQVSNSQQNLQSDNAQENSTLLVKVKHAFLLLWKHFLNAYTNTHVFKWSLWWAFATCGYLQVITYIQLLWQTSVASSDDIYNGGVEAIYTILGAAAAFGVGKLTVNWLVLGEATLAIFSFVEGVLLLVASQTYNIWLAYTVYILFGVIYHTMITIASSEVAKHLSEDSYGLVFGINTFLALLLQSFLTFIVVSESTLALAIRHQYIVYGGYFIILGTIFMVMASYTIIRQCRGRKNVSLRSQDIIMYTEDNCNPVSRQTKEC